MYVRIIYIYTMMKILTNKITIEISTFHMKLMLPAMKHGHEPERQSWLTFKNNG